MPESREISDRADSLAGKPTTTSSLRLKRSDVLRSLKHCLLAQSLGHHAIDCLEECLRVVERGSARRSSLKGRERAIRGRWTVFVERTRLRGPSSIRRTVKPVSKAALEKLESVLRDGAGAHNNGVFPAHRHHLELN